MHSRILLRRNFAVGRRFTTRGMSSRASDILSSLGIPTNGELSGVYDGQWKGSGDLMSSVCPTTGEVLARVKTATPGEVRDALERTREAYTHFRNVPAPRRGELLRQIREALSAQRENLGGLVSLEMGKIKTEGVGEVQEFVDICDYAVGLSRMMNGRVVASERPGHTILEVPNPLGVVGVLSAFNFPVAVYGWNLALSMAAGNATIWKPSPTTPLCSIAVTKIIANVLEKNGIPGAVASLVTGGKDAGKAVVESHDVELASIIMPDADLSLAVPAVFFGAVGTAGQRCTSTRRLYLQRQIAPVFLGRLQKLYSSLSPGDPLVDGTLLGPLHSRSACETYAKAVQHLRASGAEILTGGNKYEEGPLSAGNFVEPTVAIPRSAAPDTDEHIWKTETFAPILNVAIFDDIEQAISWNNGVPQGLSSSLWTRDLRNLGKWIGPSGSDTGIVNVNVGTSGAEIGAAFGGNKASTASRCEV
ncbi:hypothetical protein NLJ89_g7847 [Agrocybe chaxingu]|uniref:Aldehyde dehydrogenase domain-containing protein n=1 Tax=Agrocybe chaxingu TaxID=84603 RepID=A0A9W8K3K8_9AGAR|nr:hypothetical protein NLJ89_g7847 [Agrocybe chaxingu]